MTVSTDVPSLRERALAAKDPGVLRSKGKTREEWIVQGGALGEQEASRRGESGETRDARVRRAQAYAAWEWDGKPEGGAHLVEFGVSQPKTYLPAWLGADTKPEKRK